LEILSPVDDHGRFTDEASLPNLTGKYVFDANTDIINLLRERRMLLGQQNFHHSYPYCWRSKTPIIFRNVEQFFIRIDELRGRALSAIHNEVKWIPGWGENRIAGTVESRPDWVISRQRSWGVPLPVFYSKDGEAILDAKIIRKLAVFRPEQQNAMIQSMFGSTAVSRTRRSARCIQSCAIRPTCTSKPPTNIAAGFNHP
jgi:isoleucyl-tRNA synthetase